MQPFAGEEQTDLRGRVGQGPEEEVQDVVGEVEERGGGVGEGGVVGGGGVEEELGGRSLVMGFGFWMVR